jgi:putative ABC transport system substrate-binding protein
MQGKNAFCLVVFVLFTLVSDAEAQQANKNARIGYLSVGSVSSEASRLKAFRDGLRQLGYVEGQNIAIEYRYGEGNTDRLAALAAELVHLKVDVIVAGGAPVRAAKSATSTIPIVMTVSTDPVAQGYVQSLAKPGGNVMGLSPMAADLGGKRLELFKETFPKVRRLGVLATATNELVFRETQTSAQALGFRIHSHQVQGPQEFEEAFTLMTKDRVDGIFTVASVLLTANRKRIVDFAAKNRLPAIYHNEDFIEAGGLMSYAPSLIDMHRRAAIFVDKILKGTKPADLPVEQPMKFEFVVNLKTAKQIGVTIPPNVLVRADRVIK